MHYAKVFLHLLIDNLDQLNFLKVTTQSYTSCYPLLDVMDFHPFDCIICLDLLLSQLKTALLSDVHKVSPIIEESSLRKHHAHSVCWNCANKLFSGITCHRDGMLGANQALHRHSLYSFFKI